MIQPGIIWDIDGKIRDRVICDLVINNAFELLCLYVILQNNKIVK
jgi:hypothetical protein